MHDIAGNYDQVTVRKALLTGPACRQLDRVVFGRAPPCGGFQRDRRRKLLGVGERGCVGGGTLLMRAALPALDAASALIDPDGYLWMFGGSNGPGRSAAHPGVHSVGHRPSPTSFLMRAALPALDAASALIDPDGYLWMFGGSNGPGRSAAHPGVHSVGHRPSPSSLPSAVTPKTGAGQRLAARRHAENPMLSTAVPGPYQRR